MARRLGILFSALAIFQVLGGPLAALQTVAWVRMVATYSQDDGVGAGIAKTFDGQHMCSLCKAIAKKRGTEQKDLGDDLLNKIHLQCSAISVQLFPPEAYWLHQIDNSVSRASSIEPLLRPPISI